MFHRFDLRPARKLLLPALLAGIFVAAAAKAAEPIPVSFSPPPVAPELAPPTVFPQDLDTAANVQLQLALEETVGKLKLQDAIRGKHLAVSLVDITDPAKPQLAMINGDHMLYAASLPKIAILFGVFAKAEAGLLKIDAAVEASMRQMIRRSSNTEATANLNRVGLDYMAQVLQSDQYKLYDAKRNGGLWCGRAYASGQGGRKGDPLHGLSHGATAYQVARFYYLIETGQLVSPEASKRMKEILGSPEIHHKFVGGLEKSRPGSQLFRKSGTWRNFHADSAIVERAGRRYIAVALSDDPRGGDWMKELIVGMDDVIFSAPTAKST